MGMLLRISKYFSKAGSARFFHQICILLRLKAFKNRLLCVEGTYLTDIKYSTAISLRLKLAGSPWLPTRSSAQVGAGGFAKSVCEKQEEEFLRYAWNAGLAIP